MRSMTAERSDDRLMTKDDLHRRTQIIVSWGLGLFAASSWLLVLVVVLDR
jgi:hypothetical protein